MAGNSQRKGAIKKTGKGNPTAGSGGRVRRGLEGKGPTPKAKDRPYHQAHKAAKRRERDEVRRGRPKRRGTSRRGRSGSPAATPSSRRCGPACRSPAVYVAEGAERDGRLREAFRLAAEHGIWPCSR